uniref:Uncharacterized protein LOC114330676 n=1 Tax=Diabrotica virgifera virgifera TaxID=50390 RepID=A0A6P7FIF9_DIAVI
MELCEYCGKTFTLKKNLYAHIRNLHKVKSDCVVNKLRCSLCETYHKVYEDLRDHYIKVHNIEIFMEKTSFSSMEDFTSWKDEKEKQLQCSYVKETGTKISSSGKKWYYICHRSGYHKDEIKSSKASKRQGVAKMNSFCPSTL